MHVFMYVSTHEYGNQRSMSMLAVFFIHSLFFTEPEYHLSATLGKSASLRNPLHLPISEVASLHPHGQLLHGAED